MVRGKVLLQSTIVAGLLGILHASGIDDVWINPRRKAVAGLIAEEEKRGLFSLRQRDTVEVEFLAESSLLGKLLKGLVAGANTGVFGAHTLYLAPFQSV